jgi:GNAT superfamily N-acetyltransferase
MLIEKAQPEDLDEILSLQKLAYQSEAELCNDYSIPPLTQTLDGMIEDYRKMLILKALEKDQIIGSVRAYMEEGVCRIGRLIVHPDHQNKGIGRLSVPLIIIGNGIGAFVVRELTIGNIDRIKKLKYLKNGVMYSIFFLGTVMLAEGFGIEIRL